MDLSKLPGAPANLISLNEWKALARQGKAPERAVLRKQYIATGMKGSGAAGSRERTFTISTSTEDRDRDTVSVSGWDLKNWLKNPVVLWAHMYGQLPVAKGTAAITTAEALKATAEFAPREMYPFADTVLQMLDGGFLNACSVGFRVGKWSYNEDRGGFDILEQEMLEFSVVPVPANPEALQDAKSFGIDVAPLKSWCEQVLDGLEPGLWVPKAQVLAAFKTLTPPSVTVPGAGETKGGRTFSAANAERIRGAHEACTKAISHLEECIEQMDDADDDEDGDEGDDEKGGKAAVQAAVITTEDSLKRALKTARMD